MANVHLDALDGLGVVLGTEHRRARHKRICTRLNDLPAAQQDPDIWGKMAPSPSR